MERETPLRPALAIGLSLVALGGMAAAIVVALGGSSTDDFTEDNLALLMGAVAIGVLGAALLSTRLSGLPGQAMLALSFLLAAFEVMLAVVYL